MQIYVPKYELPYHPFAMFQRSSILEAYGPVLGCEIDEGDSKTLQDCQSCPFLEDDCFYVGTRKIDLPDYEPPARDEKWEADLDESLDDIGHKLKNIYRDVAELQK